MDEVDDYVERAIEEMGPDASERIREFASTDDGKELVMVNLNKYRERPSYPDGREVNMSSREVVELYVADAAFKLLMRASHPLIGVEPIVSLGGEGDFERTKWDRVNFIRYRSRRDFLEFILDPSWEKGVEHKWAALERTHSGQ